MGKPELKITRFDGFNPVEGICTECQDRSLFQVMFPRDVKKPQDALNELEGDFRRHLKKAHSGEDFSQAAARIVREATERK